MDINTVNLTAYQIPIESFKKIVKTVLKKENIKQNFSISLVFLGERSIKNINKRYRGKNQVTTVLSFLFAEIQKPTKKDLQFIEPKEADNLLGEILLCPSRIKKIAKRQKEDFNNLLNFFFLHGFLHLLGYNHKNTKDTKDMRKKEKEILLAINE